MPVLQLAADEGLFYEWESPSEGGLTFVFVDAGDLRELDRAVAAPLRTAGHGTLLFHCRGQPVSPARPGHLPDDDARLADLAALLAALRPERPVLVHGDPPAGMASLHLPMLRLADPERLLAFAREHAA